MNTARFSVGTIIKQSILMIYAVMVFSLLTGATFDHAIKTLIQDVPVIIILIPAFINLTGDLSDVFASRLTSYLYKGEIDYNLRPYRLYIMNYLAILSVALTSFLFAAIFGNIFAYTIYHETTSWGKLILVVLLSGITGTAIMTLLATVLVRITIKYNLDPDSIISPITTTGGDFIGSSLLILFVKLILI